MTARAPLPRRFVLLDRDGTIIVEKDYLSDPEGVELIPGAAAGLRHLRSLGFGLAVVTNQSGIGRGYYGLEDMHAVNARMEELLGQEGASLDAVYFCPHAPHEGCACRKPQPGMALQAARDFGFSVSGAIVIGDKIVDLDLARALGAAGILVRTGYGSRHAALPGAENAHVADDLRAAARLIERWEADARGKGRA